MKIDWEIISNGIVSLVLANIGLVELIKKDFYQAILYIILAITIVIFTNKNSQIKKDEKEIEELKSKIEQIQKKSEIDEKILNTLKDIIFLKKNEQKR